MRSGDSVGSGFLCEIDGAKWIVTNEHVTRGGSPFVARFLDGEEVIFNEPSPALRRDLNMIAEVKKLVSLDDLDTGNFEVASNRAIVRMRVDVSREGLNIASGTA